MCQWYNFCLPEAQEKDDLSLVPGINKKIKSELLKIPIKNYAELAQCTPDDISQIEELNGEKGRTIILQAKALKEKKIYLKSMPQFLQENGEVFIDFESDLIFDEKGTELTRIDYLIGLLKNEKGKQDFKHLLLEDSEDQLLADFMAFLKEHMDCTFYHYGHYEQTIFTSKWETLPKVRLANIEKIVKDSLIMPVTSYSLKNIAKVLGFKWKNTDANAMQSMCWYSSYLETKDRRFLDLSVQYNHDDCLALYLIKEWLVSLREKEVPVETFINIEEIKMSGLV